MESEIANEASRGGVKRKAETQLGEILRVSLAEFVSMLTTIEQQMTLELASAVKQA